MANQVYIVDELLKKTLTIAGGSAEYTSAFDLYDNQRVAGKDLELVVDLTVATGSHVLELIGDTDPTMDGSSVVGLTMPTKTVSNKFTIPIPPDFNYRYIGIKSVSATKTGSLICWLQPIGY